ncbi:MAG TPA: hypothetical protein VK973_15210 [Arenicellales bacterium]|nr:hypothetical protein [Arenicellales bacterium]
MKTARIFSLGLVLVLLSIATGGARADLGRDTHIQESGEVRIEVDRQVFDEFARMFALGYPPATVMMHAISTGMSINDVLYIAVKSQPDRSREFYDTAESLVPALPGWVCQADSDRSRYTQAVLPDDLGDNPTIRRVAELYMREGRRVVPFPDWDSGQVHMEAAVEELASLVSDHQWYRPGADDGTPRTSPNRPVFVSIYRHNGDIVVDSGLERIRRAREQGVERLPVVLVYNDAQQRPISAFPEGTRLEELAQRFYAEGVEITAVPEWRVGDHHKTASVEELRQVVDVPTRDDVSEQHWAAVEEAIRGNGMALPDPLLLTLVRSGQGRAWVDDPATIAVADELGIDSLPIVLFYHRLDRQACGQPSSCEVALCEAATAAGAPPGTCEPGDDGSERTAATRAATTAMSPDPRLYQGLNYTQDMCAS